MKPDRINLLTTCYSYQGLKWRIIKRNIFATLLTGLAWVVITISANAQMSSPNFKIPTQALSASGGAGTSTNFKQPVSIGGQSTPAGPATSTNFDNFAGYLYTLVTACAVLGDLDRSGVADITDCVLMINCVFLEWPSPDCFVTYARCGDLKQDGIVEIADVVCLINHVFLEFPVPCQ